MRVEEVCEKQNKVIELLSDTVDGLFSHLPRYLTTEEMDALPEIGKIEEAVRIRQSVKGGTDH